MYDLLVLLHILSAMVWVGGGFLVLAVTRRARRLGGSEGADEMVRALEWTENWIFTPAPLLVIATGVTMVVVSDAWAFSQAWIYLALGLIVVEFVAGDRDVNRMKAAQAQAGAGPEFATALNSYLRFGAVALTMLGVIVFLMVFKPGA